MATERKFVSLSKLGLYDEKIKKVITDGDAAALQAAKDYADSLEENYDAAGLAATAKSEAVAYTDAEIVKVNTAVAEAKTQADKGVADAATADGKAVAAQTAADNAQTDVDNLSEYVGTIPSDYTETNVIAYINKKAQETLDAASGGSSESAASVLQALNTYKAENDPKVTKNTEDIAGLTTALDEEIARAGVAEKANADAIKAISDDYLKKTDKEELQGNIDVVSGKVTTLIGEDANKSVRTIANEELAKQLITENAAESLDTLAEIAAWIQSHPDDASAMNQAIEALEAKVDTGNKTVSAYVTDAIAALSIGDYAKAADLTTLAGRVSELETAAATHATKTEVGAVSDALTEYKNAHKDDYTNAQVDAAIQAVADDVAALNDTYASDAELTAAIQSEVTRANGAYAGKAYETTVDGHISNTTVHITADERTLWNGALQSSDVATGTANGTIAVKGTDVAVKGLGSAAYAETSAFDAAGAASAVDTKLTAEVDRATAKETELQNAINAFVEVSEAEINALFQQ